MEKLINLLNEYEYSLFEDKSLATQWGDIQDWVVFEKDFCEDLDKPRDLTMDVTHLISHRFGFIEWLVENDKIDLLQLDNRIALSMSIEFNKVERVLMALSISDTPIEDLLLYLK